MQEHPVSQYVVRIFNGPLQGCEFVLDRRRTLFVVGSEAQFCAGEHLPTLPDEALYIPLEAGGCNFEIVFEDNMRSGCMIRELAGGEVHERALPLQTMTTVGALQIAVRSSDESWQSELLLPQAGPGTPLVVRVPGTRWQQLMGGTLIAVVLGAAMFMWAVSRPTPVSNVEALLSGVSTDMAVLYGRDNAVYVFANSERDANWGRQVLVRNGYAANQVLTTYDEQSRLQALLTEQLPAVSYHRLDLANPAEPRLLISRQRNPATAEMKKSIQAHLQAAMPYARSVHVVSSDDSQLVQVGEEGLRRLSLPYTRQINTDSVTFTIEGSLDDAQLQALSHWVSEFYQQWGDRYVHFAIELKDDWMKGKSFQYGADGYIKMTPSSWYFPKPL